MRWQYQLTQPQTGAALRHALKMALLAAGVWTALGGYFLWTVQSRVSAQRAYLSQRGRETEEARRAVAALADEAARGSQVRVAPPEGLGSAEFAREVAMAARRAGVRINEMKIGDEDKKAAQPVAAPEQPPTAEPTPAPTMDSITFEYGARASFFDLDAFLDRTLSTPRLLDVTSFSITRVAEGADSGEEPLHFQLKGTLYGSPIKP